MTAEIVDFKTQGTVKEVIVDPDEGKTFVNWTTEDFDDSEKHVPDYDGNSITAENDKLTISLSKDTDQNSSAYDSSVAFKKVYEGDFTLEFTLKYLLIVPVASQIPSIVSLYTDTILTSPVVL